MSPFSSENLDLLVIIYLPPLYFLNMEYAPNTIFKRIMI